MRDKESLRCHKFIELYHQILIVLISQIHLPQASETKTWIYNRKTGILWIMLQSIWFPVEKLSFVKNKTGARSPILHLWSRILLIFNWHSITWKYHSMGFMAVLCSFGDKYYIRKQGTYSLIHKCITLSTFSNHTASQISDEMSSAILIPVRVWSK